MDGYNCQSKMYKHNLEGYKKGLEDKITIFRQMVDKFIGLESPQNPFQMYTILRRYLNRVPLGTSPYRINDTFISEATDGNSRYWDVILTYDPERDRLLLVDRLERLYRNICWKENCLFEINDRVGDKKESEHGLMLCPEHSVQGVYRELISKWPTHVTRAPYRGNRLETRRPVPEIHTNADVVDAFSALACNLKEIVTGDYSCQIHGWTHEKISRVKGRLSTGEVFFRKPGVYIALDGFSGRLIFTTPEITGWKYKCEHKSSDQTEFCFHSALQNSRFCVCHRSEEELLQLAQKQILIFAGFSSWEECGKQDFDQLISKISRMKVYSIAEQYAKVSVSERNQDLKLELRYLSPTGQKITQHYFMCPRNICREWIKAGKPCQSCTHRQYRVSLILEKGRNLFAVTQDVTVFNDTNPTWEKFKSLNSNYQRLKPENIIIILTEYAITSDAANGLAHTWCILSRIEADRLGIQTLQFVNQYIALGNCIWFQIFETLRRNGWDITTMYKLDASEDPACHLFSIDPDDMDRLWDAQPSIYCHENDELCYVGLRMSKLGERRQNVLDHPEAAYHKGGRDVSRFRLINGGKSRTLAICKDDNGPVVETIFMLAIKYGQEIIGHRRQLINKFTSTATFPPRIFISELQRAIYCLYGESFIAAPKMNLQNLFEPSVIECLKSPADDDVV